MTAEQTALSIIRNLLAITDRFATPSGHLDHREAIDFRGVCVGHRTFKGGERVKDGQGYRIANQVLSGVCAPSCQAWKEAARAAREYLADHDVKQLTMLDGAA